MASTTSPPASATSASVCPGRRPRAIAAAVSAVSAAATAASAKRVSAQRHRLERPGTAQVGQRDQERNAALGLPQPRGQVIPLKRRDPAELSLERSLGVANRGPHPVRLVPHQCRQVRAAAGGAGHQAGELGAEIGKGGAHLGAALGIERPGRPGEAGDKRHLAQSCASPAAGQSPLPWASCPAMSKSLARVAAALSAAGLPTRPLEMDAGTRTAAEAAAAVGCSLDQIVKSLVFVGEQTGWTHLFLTAGGRQVIADKAEATAGEPLRRADATEVRGRTGFAIGGVAPIGHSAPVTVWIDRRLLDFDEVWAAAGTPRHVFGVAPQRLAEIAGASAADFAA